MESTKQDEKSTDPMFSGVLIISVVIGVVVLVVYLLSLQKKAENCVSVVGSDGTLTKKCLDITPTPIKDTGPVQFLDNLQEKKQDALDKQLQVPM